MNTLNLQMILVLVGTSCGLAALAMAGFGLRAYLATLEARFDAQAQQIFALERDLGALLSCSRQIGDRISNQDRGREALQKQIDRLRCGTVFLHAPISRG